MRTNPSYALIAVTSLIASSATAEVPLELDYQGYVTDSSGAPLNGTVTIDVKQAGTNESLYVPFATTRGLAVASGPTTFNLVCRKSNTADSAVIFDASLTALYVPTRY